MTLKLIDQIDQTLEELSATDRAIHSANVRPTCQAGCTRAEALSLSGASSDRGASWSGQINVSRLGSVGVTDPEDEHPVRTGDIIPEIASDERADHDEVYVVWQDARFNNFQRDQVAFSRSTDGGLTWSTPVRISTDNETQAFTPAIRVDDAGNIGVTYYGTRSRSAVHALDRQRRHVERGARHTGALRYAFCPGCQRLLCG